MRTATTDTRDRVVDTEVAGCGRRKRATIGVVTIREMSGDLVRLRSLHVRDRRRILEMRATPEVMRRWRGFDLGAEFDADLDDAALHQFAIEINGGRVVGMIQFGEELDPDYRHASIDIFVDPSEHGRGFATDAIRTLVRYLIDERGHHRLVIDPAADNAPAIACYSKVGFTPVGVMRSYERQLDGNWADGLLMELLATDVSRAGGDSDTVATDRRLDGAL